MLSIRVISSILILVLLFFTACTDQFFYSDLICVGLELETIQVVDQDNNPVTGAEITVINKRTGKPFCVDDKGIVNESCANTNAESDVENGVYTLISTVNTRPNEPTADVKHLDIIEATIEKSGVSATYLYIVELNSGRCHPEKVEGPRLVTLDLP